MTLFVIYVLMGAAIFQEIESGEQLKQMNRIYKTRMEILTKYNITQGDAKRFLNY